MTTPTSREIRQQFIDYFVEKQGHTFVPSSPVVPHDDPTLLFANAGMNQFKDVFLATGTRPYTRAANTQKCIRAGGKHNDLEDVGKDTYHHTFFEMLGNWSFGDYFKREAIAWAWDLLTNVWGMPKDRLHATVFVGDEKDGVPADTEAEQLWKEVTDINPAHISRWDKKDNFWEMGETGPCGPCSEIHIDLTPDKSGAGLVNRDDPRVMEIWNLVFMQFNRGADGSLSPLPATHVDTGMGFERLCAVLQGKTSNYDTDVFTPLFEAIHSVTGARPYGASMTDPADMAYRVIADHIRTLTFALTDGANPGNEGRGYVLRRILRRAVRHGWQTLGVKKPFLCKLVPAVVDSMGDAFPELAKQPQQVAEIIREEEESFERTLDRGIALFNKAADDSENNVVSADDAFMLHDTYGFPLDLTQVMAEERGMTVDARGFQALMEEARERARAAGARGVAGQSLLDLVQKESLPATKFTGYDGTTLEAATVCLPFAVSEAGYRVLEQVVAGDEVVIVTGHTPFYAESGGQVGDTGTIETAEGDCFRVTDTQKVGDAFFHVGVVERGSFSRVEDEAVTLKFTVDAGRRARIMANHTSTHVMNHKLRNVLGDHVMQRGSLVDDEKTRFDFSHNQAMTVDQVRDVEQQVNGDIAADLPVYCEYVPQEDGLAISSLRAVFGEKYPPVVRVLSVGVPVKTLVGDPKNDDWAEYSIEFCGGTHLSKTSDAGAFAIVSEEAIAKGVRRVIAITGDAARQSRARGEALLGKVQAARAVEGDALAQAVAELQPELEDTTLPLVVRTEAREAISELQKKIKAAEKAKSKAAAGNVVETARELADQLDGNVLVAAVEGADARSLRAAMDVIRKKRPDAAMMLAAVSDDKIAFLAAVPDELIGKGLKAGDWVRDVAQAAGGGGGGRPDMAQAGGKDAGKLEDALAVAREFAQAKLS